MIKVAWDVEELVALIDVYRKSDGKTTDQIEKELMDLSKSRNRSIISRLPESREM